MLILWPTLYSYHARRIHGDMSVSDKEVLFLTIMVEAEEDEEKA